MIYPDKKLEPIVRDEELVAKCKEAATMDQALVILEITHPKVKKLIRSARVGLVEQIGTLGTYLICCSTYQQQQSLDLLRPNSYLINWLIRFSPTQAGPLGSCPGSPSSA